MELMKEDFWWWPQLKYNMAAERQMGPRPVSEDDLLGKLATLITRSIFLVKGSETHRWIEENVHNRSISKALHKVVILHHHFPWW